MSTVDFPEITPVREAHRFDEGRLIEYLNAELDGDFSDLQVNQFEGGQSNPTYLLESRGIKYVMRKKTARPTPQIGPSGRPRIPRHESP